MFIDGTALVPPRIIRPVAARNRYFNRRRTGLRTDSMRRVGGRKPQGMERWPSTGRGRSVWRRSSPQGRGPSAARIRDAVRIAAGDHPEPPPYRRSWAPTTAITSGSRTPSYDRRAAGVMVAGTIDTKLLSDANYIWRPSFQTDGSGTAEPDRAGKCGSAAPCRAVGCTAVRDSSRRCPSSLPKIGRSAACPRAGLAG